MRSLTQGLEFSFTYFASSSLEGTFGENRFQEISDEVFVKYHMTVVSPQNYDEFVRKLSLEGIDARTDFEDFLRDESKFRGSARGLICARNESDVLITLKLANELRVPLTVSSARTSVTGSSVPLSGFILDMGKLDFLDADEPSIVGPGVILADYKKFLEDKGLFYPPDPTSEASCTIGGNIACNASGAISYRYGPTRKYTQGLRLALPTGRVLDLERGVFTAENGLIKVPASAMEPPGGNDLTIPMPQKLGRPWEECKNSTAVFVSENQDLLDLFVGSEGIFGVFLSVKTKLLPKRRPFFGLNVFIPSREAAVRLVTTLDAIRRFFQFSDSAAVATIGKYLGFPGDHGVLGHLRYTDPSCIEWLGNSTAPLLSAELAHPLRESYGCLYIEQEYDGEPFESLGCWAELLTALDCMRIEPMAALDIQHIRRIRTERRSVPERLNELIPRGMVKIGTDFAVPLDKLEELLKIYDNMLPQGNSFLFGHIGNAHLHANILPKSESELKECRDLLPRMARKIRDLGGALSGEHGVGKLKREMFEMMSGNSAIEHLKNIKAVFDPNSILNMGNLIHIP